MKTTDATTPDKLNLTAFLFNDKGKKASSKVNFLNLFANKIKHIAGLRLQNQTSVGAGQTVENSNPPAIHVKPTGNIQKAPFIFRSISALTAPNQPSWQTVNPMQVFEQPSASQGILWTQSATSRTPLISSEKSSDSINAKISKIGNRDNSIKQITLVNSIPVLDHSGVIRISQMVQQSMSVDHRKSIVEKNQTILQSEPSVITAHKAPQQNHQSSVHQSVPQNYSIPVPGSDQMQFNPAAENAQNGQLAEQMKINPSVHILPTNGKQGLKSTPLQTGPAANHRQKISPETGPAVVKEPAKTFAGEKTPPISAHNNAQMTMDSPGISGRQTDNPIVKQTIDNAVPESRMVNPEIKEVDQKLASLNAKILNTTIQTEATFKAARPVVAETSQPVSSHHMKSLNPDIQDTKVVPQAEKIPTSRRNVVTNISQPLEPGTSKNAAVQNSETDTPAKVQDSAIREQNSIKNNADSGTIGSGEKIDKVTSSTPGSNQKQTSENSDHQPWSQKTVEKTMIQPKVSEGFSRVASTVAVEKIVDMVEKSIMNRKYHVNFRVDTGEMGEIEMRFTREAGVNQGTIVVNSEHALSEFQKLIPGITEQLTQKNIDLSMLNVQMNDSNRNRSPQHKKRSFDSSGSDHYTIGEKIQENLQRPMIHDYGYNTVEYIA